MRYLLIDESGGIYKTDSVTESEFDASRAGILTIIEVSTMQVHDSDLSEFVDIEEWRN